ncbi:EAL domain-containing protein [Salinisphaera sp. SPP-AMP-43]|uniref:putative bifunctional diguanylate cyclase/phosphodiesterase n=1 Tax=Salinisphaera sp. SPP-AMP-43 TaxID=3121288 RepID=UPI003C6E9082
MTDSNSSRYWRQRALKERRARLTAQATAKRTANKLAASQARLGALSEHLEHAQSFRYELFTNHPLPLLLIDAATLALIDVNTAAEHCYGYDRHTFLSLTLVDLGPAAESDSFERWRQWLNSAIQTPDCCHQLTQSGRPLEVELSAHAVHHQTQPAFLIVARDVTIEKQRERSLELRNQALEGSHNGLFICANDDTAGVHYANSAMARLCGKSQHQIIGCALTELFATPEHEVLDQLTRALRAGQPARAVIPVQHGPENAHWLDAHITPVFENDGDIGHWIGVVQDITERKNFEELLTYHVNHDHLTGLPNRELLRERLTTALKSAAQTGNEIAVLMLDLDHFKRINDTKGHDAGDILLREIAKRLSRRIRSHDTLARISGDEFVLLTAAPRLTRSLPALAARLQDVFSRPFAIHEEQLCTSCSMGIATYPQDGADTETLLRRADLAMYEAKSAGGQAVRWFDPVMEHKLRDRAVITAAMRQSLDQDEFELHYQPQVDMAEQSLVGLEALLRWPTADESYRRPDQFIPVAEETGMIIDLGRWVLNRACRDLAQLRESGHTWLRMAINVSAIQLGDPHFVATVRDTLERFQLPPQALEIEITESVFLTEDAQSTTTLETLHTMGIPMAIDDFGTGYSSLSYLSRLPIQRLKIDKSFIQGLNEGGSANELVRNLIRMALDLTIEPVAEGVETENDMQTLIGHQCLLGQGFYFSPALPLDELQQRMTHWRTPLQTGDSSQPRSGTR